MVRSPDRKGRRHVARVFKAKGASVSFESNISGYFHELAEKMQSDILAQASYEGAKIFYDSMKLNVPVGETGNLAASIYHWFDRKQLTAGKGVWYIGPNKSKAPHWWLAEYGHVRVHVIYFNKEKQGWRTSRKRLKTPRHIPPPRPYIRPTYYGNVDRALSASMARLKELVIQA